MSRLARIGAVIALAFLVAPLITSADQNTNPGFEKLKALVGQWTGKSADGQPVYTSFKLAAGDTAVVENLVTPGDKHMMTVFTADHDSVVMTHFCDLGDQPRMRATFGPGQLNDLEFHFIDATNVASPTQPIMHDLTLAFKDSNHFTESWTWVGGDKHGMAVFQFERIPQ
jgi:hypothetical protein